MSADVQIKAPIPFLKGKSVLLLEDPGRPVLVLGLNGDRLRYELERQGKQLIVLPELISALNPVVADYLFPGYDVPDASALYRQIGSLAGIAGRNGFLYRKGGRTYFKEISAQDVDDAVSELLWTMQERKRSRSRTGRARSFSGDIRYSIVSERRQELDDAGIEYCSEPGAPIPVGPVDEDMDSRTRFILGEVDRLLREYNLTLDELRVIIGYKVQLSRMQITRTGKILLTDFLDKDSGQPKEVKMDPLTKMLYFFFLKHPEGVRVKEVGDYLAELMHLYMGITGRDDKDAIRASILGHVDPFGNGINVSMSRIKAAFKNQVEESVARFYWVEGKGGEPYRVALDRDFVLWEYGA